MLSFMNMPAPTYKPPRPTGNPWVSGPEDPATVPVPLPVIIVGINGPYTEQDRKLWTFLLHSVWSELDEKIIHELPIKTINDVFRQLHSRHHTDWIWDSAERLTATIIRWIRTEGDRRYKGISSLFGAETDVEARAEGTLRFHFPPLLVPILKDPRRFARLRTHFMIELSGKYAVTLYELLESVANKDTPELRASVEELRQWLKVPEGKLTRWQDFRRFVLEPAIKQINGNSAGAGFSVTMHTETQGRAVKWVTFRVTKTGERIALDAKLREEDRQPDLFDVRLKTETYEKAKQLAPRWDIYALEAAWKEWGQKQKDWPPKNPNAAFLGFCKKRGPYREKD
jgi:hypothetical protein